MVVDSTGRLHIGSVGVSARRIKDIAHHGERMQRTNLHNRHEAQATAEPDTS